MALTSVLLSILILLSTSSSLHAQLTCSPGEIESNGRCEQCPPGTYGENSTTCEPCPPGTSQPHTGAVASDLCRQCSPGTFSNSSGSTTCWPCPMGTSSNFRATKCSKCGPGTSAVMFGNGCKPCERGTYSTGKSNMVCESCPWPLSSKPGSTSRKACKPCPPGKQEKSCAPCRKNFFKEHGMELCKRCPAGTFTRGVGSTDESDCIPCPKGTYIRNQRFGSKCRPCKNGRIANGPGASYCRAPSKPCANDFFENENGDCVRCPPGWIYLQQENRCERCPIGFVSRGGKRTKCAKCTGALVPDDQSRQCTCPEGMFMVSSKLCLPCPAGTEIIYDQHTYKECTKCSQGEFKSSAGRHLCQRCPFGTVSLKEGATECTKCPEGTMPDMERDRVRYFRGSSSCVSTKARCPLGHRRKTKGAKKTFSGCERVSCQVNTPKEDINVTCAPCEKGEFLWEGECTYCEKKSVSLGGIITSCTLCKNDFFQDFYDPSKCSCRGIDTRGRGIQDGVCKRCPPGTFGSINSEMCMSCAPGTFASFWASFNCRSCESGTFASGKGSKKCEKCPDGMISEQRIRSRRCVPDPYSK